MAVLAALLVWVGGLSAPRAEEVAEAPIVPLPRALPVQREKALLGQRLFHDPRLSADNSISCASCHALEAGGMDGLRFSIGIHGQEGGINAPTVFNSVFNFRQFWNGRARDLVEQAAGPVHNPLEMGSNWSQVEAKLGRDTDYQRDFAALYPDGIRGLNIQDAIAEFERALITPDAPFDRFLRGEASALTPQQKQGYQLFKSYGCISCHQGVNVGGNMYQRFGLFGDYFQDRGGLAEADQGRYQVTGREEDRHRFKVPSLRNVARTAPYLHDGSAATLEDVVRVMARYQLGRAMPEEHLDALVAFLRSLTGDAGQWGE